ncbi:BTB/POZ domain-containing protein [Hibiscus syriacus]|uniref:BTB/POZ domain-containing protein n=1 Tax=Hibiscus syriacus TaxID=106335 RepID=A0A6A2ZGT6_HIBSY|nr:BTB/POZ domain-containing protein [Hibiscus syriacus]
MATTTTSISTETSYSHLTFQVLLVKPKRCDCKETTISCSSVSTAAAANNCSDSCFSARKLDPPTVVSADSSSGFPASTPPPPPIPSLALRVPDQGSDGTLSTFKIGYSLGSVSPVMDFTTISNGHSPSSFTKFNSALTAGLLNPHSPPPPPDKTRSSPTLFEMMANEPDVHPRTQNQGQIQVPISASRQNQPLLVIDKQTLTMQRISGLLSIRSPGNQFNDPDSSDMKLTLSSKDGINVSMNVHRQIVVAHSRFFAVKLSDRWAKQLKNGSTGPYMVEISDCDDVEAYIETLKLMYCEDLRKKLMREDVSKVLGILKVSAAIGFDAGVLSCLEYLEAAPWAEDEEEKVASLLAELRLENVGAGEVLKRVSVEGTNGTDDYSENEEVLLKLLHVVLEGKDEKARCEMKGLVLKMLRENSSQSDIRKESLYSACDGCLEHLQNHFLRAASSDLTDASQIARQADNLHWILDILIDRQIAEDFLKSWASQSELSNAHSKVPAVHRYEVSRVTARLFVGIGKWQLLASKEVRCLLLQTWLVPFYDDFVWLRRASKGLDRHLIEDSLSNTILTLPLAWQQDILLAWFNRFLNSGEDCPNIQRAFATWWRRLSQDAAAAVNKNYNHMLQP